MQHSRKLLLGLVALLLLSSLSLWAGDVVLTASELQTLKTSLTTAERKLTESETEIGKLNSLLNEQGIQLTSLQTTLGQAQSLCNEQAKQLQTLTQQLQTASVSLQKLKNETVVTTIKIVLTALACVIVGGAAGYLIAR